MREGITVMSQSCRVAVDIGGTFTDVVLDRAGVRWSTKVLTTPARPADGFLAGVEAVLGQAGVSPGEVDLVLHGTTLATNALIERRGAKTALITTEGHRDSLEIAYENRFDQYDLSANRRPPLVPRDLRLPVTERLTFDGSILVPLDEASVRALIPTLRDEGVESVAIGLLHAYANPAHERRVAEIIAAELPDVSLSLSSDVCSEIREYERQSTTVANAYVRPLMAAYLAEARARLTAMGLTCPCLLMTSAGSLVTVETAAAYPVRLVESGPAGGAILAAHIARRRGDDRVLSFDMGGTTAKICLIDDGEPLLSREFEIDRAHRFMKGSGLPVKIPVVEMVEIGAGGGSVARVDGLNRIQVGPDSAGSDPGPACYGRGGDRPTVTDGNLLLGRFDPETFAGGDLKLDVAAATDALRRDVGKPLGLDAAAAALGVIEIVDENMAAAARVHAAERGRELTGRVMIAFGGGAPPHAARLADKLGIDTVVVPGGAGVGSAVGFLLAPIAYETVRSRYTRLDAFDADAVAALLEEMTKDAKAVVALGAPEAEVAVTRHAHARYVGQGHEVKIAVAEGTPKAEALRAAFEAAYRGRFGLTVPGADVEILTWSVGVREVRAEADMVGEAAGAISRAIGDRRVTFPGHAKPRQAAVVGRGADLAVADGPLIVAEDQTSTIVPPGWRAETDARGDLVLTRTKALSETGEGKAGGTVAEDIRRQVLWDRLISIVEEQARAIIRTAFSTTVREAGDLSAGVFDPRGRMLAQAVTGTPGHVNAMAASVKFFLEAIPLETMEPGDVFVTNDPWLGTGHLFDFTVVSPVFIAGRAVALFASTVHVVDIGGRGFSPDGGQVFEEGLCIPIMPLFTGGDPNKALFDILRANTREPAQVAGDLYSLAASNEVGARRLIDLMHEFGMRDLDDLGDHIVLASEAAMRAAIAQVPNGEYTNAMTVDGYGKPVRLRATLTVTDDLMSVDYGGTDSISPRGINVPLTYAQAYTCFGLRCVVGAAVPNNAGSLAPIAVTAPEGCIVNAPRPCAVNVRHVIGQMLPDVVLGCLGRALPGRVPAEGSSSLWNPMLAGGHGLTEDADYGDATPFAVTIFHSGGTGARPGQDGLSATAFPSGVRNTPVEITEAVAPLVFRRKEYREGSGGVGAHRGGDGQIIEIEHRQGAPFAVFALFDRIDHPARGRDGGVAGAPGRVSLASGTALRGMGKQVVPAGDRLVLELPGGGGLGSVEVGTA
jgi:5-oxoprolinase (ATP-hydrolysing)